MINRGEIDIVNIIYKNFGQTKEEIEKFFVEEYEKKFIDDLNADQKVLFDKYLLSVKNAMISSTKNAIRYTLKFISEINNFGAKKDDFIYFS